MEDRKPTAIVREDRTDTLIAVLTFWGMAKAWFLNSDKDETLWQIHLEHTQQNYTQCAILSGIQKFLKSESHEMQEVTDFRSLEEHAHITVLNHVLEAAPDDQHVDTLDFTPGKPVFYVHHRSLEQFFRILRDTLQYRNQRKKGKQKLPYLLLHCNSPNSFSKLPTPPAPWKVLEQNTPNTRVQDIFKLPPPRGTRHTKCNLTKRNGKYRLTFHAGLFDQPQMFRQHFSGKHDYEAGLLLCVKNDQKGRATVVSTLTDVLHNAPICLRHQLKSHQDDFLIWLLTQETLCLKEDT